MFVLISHSIQSNFTKKMSMSKKSTFFVKSQSQSPEIASSKWNIYKIQIWLLQGKVTRFARNHAKSSEKILEPKFRLNPKRCHCHIWRKFGTRALFSAYALLTSSSSLGSLSFWKCIRKIRLWAKKSWGQLGYDGFDTTLDEFQKRPQTSKEKGKSNGSDLNNIFFFGYKTTLLLL